MGPTSSPTCKMHTSHSGVPDSFIPRLWPLTSTPCFCGFWEAAVTLSTWIPAIHMENLTCFLAPSFCQLQHLRQKLKYNT